MLGRARCTEPLGPLATARARSVAGDVGKGRAIGGPLPARPVVAGDVRFRVGLGVAAMGRPLRTLGPRVPRRALLRRARVSVAGWPSPVVGRPTACPFGAGQRAVSVATESSAPRVGRKSLARLRRLHKAGSVRAVGSPA